MAKHPRNGEGMGREGREAKEAGFEYCCFSGEVPFYIRTERFTVEFWRLFSDEFSGFRLIFRCIVKDVRKDGNVLKIHQDILR